ncbi:hypothetical protein [Pseudofrankia sp. DC12]|uniref:hypothetical protein n=1 Tax=Pseudofrankia sp. DC12 TaxID=683315 RepID=UPI000A0252FA|nr:hypothetical protein [Pseudofrankia sp. DC12]
MKGLLSRLSALDADAESAVRVIAYFDALVAARADAATLVRAAATLAECGAGLETLGGSPPPLTYQRKRGAPFTTGTPSASTAATPSTSTTARTSSPAPTTASDVRGRAGLTLTQGQGSTIAT